MKIRLAALLLCGIFTGLFFKANAQSQGEPPTLKQLPGANQSFTPSHLKAAERVLELSDVMNNLQQTFTNIIKSEAAQVPEEKRAAFTQVMQQFFTKYITEEEVKKAFVPMYASAFTEDELNQIGDFLSSPAGKAMIQKQPMLMNEGMAWGQKIVLEHQQDLTAMMNEALGSK